jgi:hypothetical protein
MGGGAMPNAKLYKNQQLKVLFVILKKKNHLEAQSGCL